MNLPFLRRVVVVTSSLSLCVACTSADPAPPADGGALVDVGVPDVASSETGSSVDAAVADAAILDAGRDAPTDAAVDAAADGGCELTTARSNAIDFGAHEVGATGGPYVPGIRVEALPCGVVPTIEEADGYLRAAHPGSPFVYRLTKAGYLTTLFGEIHAPLAIGGTGPQRFTKFVPNGNAGTVFPGYDATKANILLRIEAQSVACGTGGFTLTVDGHPEAQVSFWNNEIDGGGSTPSLAMAPANKTKFHVSITKIAPAALAPLTFTVAGAACTVTFSNNLVVRVTGKAILEAGAITSIEAVGR